MINPERSGFASKQIARAQNTIDNFHRDGGFQNGEQKEIAPDAATDTIQWARTRMESFAAIEAGKDEIYRDADSRPGSIQTNFYDRKLDATFEGDKDGAFRFTQVVSDRSSFDVPYTTTTMVEFDGEKMTKFQTDSDAWGEGSTSLQTLTSQGGVDQYYFFG